VSAGATVTAQTQANVYEAAGGAETFKLLVERFYAGVADDPLLRPLYPEADLSSATERLSLFLIQYWGGPATYSERRGHPRLRLRHQPFAIGEAERDAWFGHMTAAVDSLTLAPSVRKALLDYFDVASTAMINQPAQR
jgi:hemoglobin